MFLPKPVYPSIDEHGFVSHGRDVNANRRQNLPVPRILSSFLSEISD